MATEQEKKELRRLRAGDESVYVECYHRYHRRLYGLAFKYLKSRALAKDAVQEVFIKLWENRRSVNTNIKSWLFTSIRNHVLNMIRNNKTRIEKQAIIEQTQRKPRNTTDDALFLAEYEEILARALQQLPEGKREIFELKTVHGMSNQEIVIKLDITIHTVKSQYYEASRFIKEYLDKHAGIKMIS